MHLPVIFVVRYFSSLTSKNEVRLSPVVVDMLQVYFQKTTNKREPNPQHNRSDERRKGGEIYFLTSHRLGPAARFLASLGFCRGLFENRLVARLSCNKVLTRV